MGTLVTNIAMGIEGALVLSGLWLLVRLEVLPSARKFRRPPELAFWDIRGEQFLYYVWCILIAVFLCAVATNALLRLFGIGGDVAAVLSGAALHPGIFLGIIGAQFIFFRDMVPAKATPPRIPSLLAGAATFLVSLPVGFAASLLGQLVINQLKLPNDEQAIVGMFSDSSGTLTKALIVILAVFIVPVSEELVFRAGLFRYFLGRTPRWVAFTVPALLFASLHLSWNSQTHAVAGLVAFGPLFGLALVFETAYERTGRIATVVVAHALFNLNELVMTSAHVFNT